MAAGGCADRFLFAPADLSKAADCEAFVTAVIERWGHVDVLVNNAGVARDGVLGAGLTTTTSTPWSTSTSRARSTCHRAGHAADAAGGSGRIVNISSIVGLSGYRGLSVYSATKAALDGMTRALARELGSPRHHGQLRSPPATSAPR